MTGFEQERRPLLNVPPEADNEEREGNQITPLPMKQVSILMLMQLAEPVASTVIYPFIAELVDSTGITGGDSSKIGYYAGLIESIFFLTEGLFVLQYGRISDRIGRRPVLLFGMFGLGLSIFSFGLSKTFGALVFTRALSGALNGNVGVSKSMLGELTDETNQAQCFAFLPIVWSAGSTLGPFLGGILSHPATLIPRLFDTPFWRNYPYFLPCLLTSIFTALVLVYSFFYLKETLHRHDEPKPSLPSTAEYGLAETPVHSAATNVPSVISVLNRRACIAIINYGFLAFTDIAYLCVVPVILAASIEDGGLGLDPRSIGLILGLQGLVTGLIPVVCFAPIHRRFGSKRTYVAGLAAYVLLVLSLPVMNIFARAERYTAMWVLVGAHIVISCPAFMTFSCILIFVTAAAPSKASLGTLNGISQTTISIIRAIGPATATSLFALSVEKRILGGWLVYAVLIAVNLGGLVSAWWLKEGIRAHHGVSS